ncbi:MAG: ABC transporter ATP-binding protein [bacterium]|nr:ABC transporter ATP-binding protein [bacterium]MCM1376528.1 ABC transporter ATP-binding protein [Muribaculum sp.]
MELKINGLTKKFQDAIAVNGVTHTLYPGVYGLLGVNGAGKTTLMRMLCTLLQPTGGSVTWDGNDIYAMGGEYRRILGYLPQDFGYYPDFTVYDYLLYIASIKGLRPAAARERARELLEQVGLTAAQNKKMKKLSGGMKRRAGIAQAMLADPAILILDEPTAGLDPNERIRFRNLISELAGTRLVLLSTHIVSDIEYIAREVLLMKSGTICASGTPQELLEAMPEQVWSISLPREAVAGYMRNYKVSNVKAIPGGAELRIVSEKKPGEEAIPQTPTLEDLFLNYFGEREGESNAEI